VSPAGSRRDACTVSWDFGISRNFRRRFSRFRGSGADDAMAWSLPRLERAPMQLAAPAQAKRLRAAIDDGMPALRA
jgi:hypothetical protein